MKNIRKYMNICWLIGCQEEYDDSGYSVCYCGKHYYYDYDEVTIGLINIIRYYPEKTFSHMKEEFLKFLYPYVRFCYCCHKIEYWFGKDLSEKHRDCLPF